MPYDLREWIKRIEEMPGQLVRVKKQVKPHDFEVSTIMFKLQKQGKFPAVLFENTLNVDNEESGIPVMIGAMTQRKRLLKALGLDTTFQPQTFYNELIRRTGNLIKPEKIAEKDAPVKQVVKKGNEVNLRKLPIVRHSDMDPAPYFDMNTLSLDPTTKRYNVSWQRTMFKGPNKLGIFIAPRHLWYNLQQWAKKGEKNVPVAYCLGHNPLFSAAASVEVGMEVDEYEVAGGWFGEPLRLTPSATWGNDFLIPADAEVVLEGYIPWDHKTNGPVTETEAPFGEITGYCGPQRLSPILNLTAINMRKSPILLNCFMWYEANTYSVCNEAVMYQAAKKRVPGTIAVNGMYNLQAIISMKKMTDGDPVRAALAVLGTDIRLKHIIIVDEDTNPFDMSEVMFAIGAHVQATKNVNIITGCRSVGLDPSMVEQNITDVMIIDATRPVERPFEIKVDAPKDVDARMKLEDYIPKKELDEIPFVGRPPYLLP